MKQDQKHQFKTYGIRNLTLSVLMAYVIMIAFSSQGIYNWTTRLAVTPFTQDLRQNGELLWAAAAQIGLEEPRLSLETWFLGLQDAHPLLYPKTYARTVELRSKRQLRRMEKAQLERTNPKLAARLLKEKQTMDTDVEGSNGKRPRVLILGDSIMMTVGPVLKEAVTVEMDGSAVVRAKLATGLSRPDVFDWNSEIRSFTKGSRFDMLVMMLGTNDSQDFVENGKIMSYGTTGWVNAYNKRMQDVMKSACQIAGKVLWFGLPPMKSVNFDRKAHRINGWARKQAALSGCVEFVSTDTILGDEQGRYAAYLKVGDKLEKIRMVDGIHVTKKGGRLVSRYLLDYINSTLTGSQAVAH
jgi:hypothetical protein